ARSCRPSVRDGPLPSDPGDDARPRGCGLLGRMALLQRPDGGRFVALLSDLPGRTALGVERTGGPTCDARWEGSPGIRHRNAARPAGATSRVRAAPARP